MIYSEFIKRERDFPVLIKALKNREPVLARGIPEEIKPFFIKSITEETSRRTVVVLPDETRARELSTALSLAFPKCFFCPARENELVNFDSSARDFGNLRALAVERIAECDYDIIITTLEALLQLTVPKEDYLKNRLVLKIGEEKELSKILSLLVGAGYERSERVDGKGQFAVRGDILDIFPPSSDHPVRIEFFGDEVDAMGIFDPISQRRTENIREISIPPATEIFFSEEKTKAIVDFLRSEMLTKKNAEELSFLSDTKDRIESGNGFARDLFLGLNYKKATLLDYFDGSEVFIFGDEAELINEIDGAKALLSETVLGLIERHHFIGNEKQNSLLLDFDDFARFIGKTSAVILDNFGSGRKKIAPIGIYSFSGRRALTSFGNMSVFDEDITSSLDEGYITLIAVPNMMRADYFAGHLRKCGKEVKIVSDKTDEKFSCGIVYAVYPDQNSLPLQGGFEFADSKFRVFCDSAAEAKKRVVKKKSANDKFKEKITSFSDLEVGDYVVHTTHGIGKFCGIELIKSIDGVVKDFVKIQYAGSDVLYVPSSNLDSVSKYIGPKSDSANLRLSKMGGAEWKKTTAKAKKSAQDIAKKLISLYAGRMKLPGFAFAPDSRWQHEFEEAFPYGETPSQLKATEEIKSDMERSCPMDRLLCGDVGFGKTEVALRGVFKCIMDNKQAAILVPTTILAWQHYQTMLSRFKGYPVKIEMLSRFRTKKEQENIIKKLKSGEIDVVVGTHRLLQNDISFRDLGFLVVDEEQRFGVTHKERLKEMSRGVDVLTLTATPIPRTLNMALGGIRDMSILEEAPEDRLPVQTFVLEYDIAVIAEAIRREKRRGGQVFYLINNIDELELRAAQIERMFPDAAVAVAHGALDKDALSDIWKDMTDHKIDILFCTTIIETGIDLPDANTLIIENADRFGLSQLHQIRGRVGRSDRRAYAFLTYRGGKCLSEISEKRLEAIREYTEFGSGFKIALRDLELRGAGNLLGAEQSGHLDSVGYDLYMKLLNDAVLEEKGEKAASFSECTVDLPVSAFLPEKYVPSNSDRLEIYRKIAGAHSDGDIDELRDELFDRFGDIPREVENLFSIVKVKWLGENVNCRKINYSQSRIKFLFENADVAAISLLAPIYASRLFISLDSKPHIELTCDQNNSIIDLCEEVLSHIAAFSESINNENEN